MSIIDKAVNAAEIEDFEQRFKRMERKFGQFATIKDVEMKYLVYQIGVVIKIMLKELKELRDNIGEKF